MRRARYVSIVCVLLLSSCGMNRSDKHACEIKEHFITERASHLDLDSIAIWHGEGDQHWVVSTAKKGDILPVYDAITGVFVKNIGKPGTLLGELSRPNGIAIVDDLVFVTERDNKRLQIFSLPDGMSIGMTSGIMQQPYGIAVMPDDTSGYSVYVMDNFSPQGKNAPKCVHIYHVERKADNAEISFKHTFGDQEGSGALIKVESIAIDKAYNRLIIADEHKSQKSLKLYTLSGEFTGQVVGEGLFKHEPEGIALYQTGLEIGYVIATDQDRIDNKFYIFDRKSLAHVATFKGMTVRNTDGIAVTNEAFGPFVAGAFYAVHDDGSVCAYDWHTLAQSCGLQEAP